MTSPSKRKGNNFEREVVKKAIDVGLTGSRRAWASDGRSLGLPPDVDIVFAVREQEINSTAQAKIRKKIASFLKIPDGCDSVVFRMDRGPTLVLTTLDTHLRLLRDSINSK